jgi:hypothetical protein
MPKAVNGAHTRAESVLATPDPRSRIVSPASGAVYCGAQSAGTAGGVQSGCDVWPWTQR